MGAAGNNEKVAELFSAYKSFENIINYIKNFNKLENEHVYLISTKTIPNFISIIKKYYGNEKKLKKHFADYELERNIKIYSNYLECINVAKNTDENEFIIVDKEFIDNMEIRDYNSVILEVDKDNSKITFPVSQYQINFKQKGNELGIYEFFINNDEFNPSTLVKEPKISKSISQMHKNNNLNNNFNENNNNVNNNIKSSMFDRNNFGFNNLYNDNQMNYRYNYPY